MYSTTDTFFFFFMRQDKPSTKFISLSPYKVLKGLHVCSPQRVKDIALLLVGSDEHQLSSYQTMKCYSGEVYKLIMETDKCYSDNLEPYDMVLH